MEHLPAGSRATKKGSPDWFTGEVDMTPVFDAPPPAQQRSAIVRFAPGARTHWHTHPCGQMIHVLSGRGRAQSEGGPVVLIGPGDTVWFGPGERHWHGADPDSPMEHLAVQKAQDGVAVTWAEPVIDGDYLG